MKKLSLKKETVEVMTGMEMIFGGNVPHTYQAGSCANECGNIYPTLDYTVCTTTYGPQSCGEQCGVAPTYDYECHTDTVGPHSCGQQCVSGATVDYGC